MRYLLLISVAIMFGGCGFDARVPQAEELAVNDAMVCDETALTERTLLDVSVCDLKNDPARYNRSYVKLTGYFSRGFEDSSLYDPGCQSNANQWIWVEMGGRKSVGVIYCCNVSATRTRDEELEVDGLKLPLVDDKKLNEYDDLLEGGKNVKATVIGTFFSGRLKQSDPDGPFYYGGYGHFGMGSLFVVQQVLSAKRSAVENK